GGRKRRTDRRTLRRRPAEVGVRMADVTFPRIGVIGGGQLARVLAPAAEALGIRFSVLAETADAPAAQVINEVSVGDYTDYPTLKAFAETVRSEEHTSELQSRFD